MLRLYASVLPALLLLPLAACETTTSGGAVGAGRPQLMLVSSQQLDRMGAESYARLPADAASKGVLNRDGAMLQRVRMLATRFSRSDESEADRIGLELAARAGYDPRAGVTLWRKMIDAHGAGRAPEFLSSHPADSSRVQQIAALLPTVMPLYQTALGRR